MTTNQAGHHFQQPGQFQPAGPQAYATAPYGARPPAPGNPAPPTRKPRNVIGIVAFVAAVLGFIFAVWEGAYLLGWILLPIAFVLSLVALFQSGKGKNLAIAALIISIVGTVAGVLAFTFSAARAFDDAFSGGPVSAAPPSGVIGDTREPQGDNRSEVGSRANPYPLGTAISSRDWTVTVNSFNTNATGKVMGANSFNEEPPSGKTWALANVTVTYIGDDSASPSAVGVSYVTGSGNTVQTYDAFAVVPNQMSTNELYNGASATGNVGLLIPEGDAGTLRIRPGYAADEVFVAFK